MHKLNLCQFLIRNLLVTKSADIQNVTDYSTVRDSHAHECSSALTG